MLLHNSGFLDVANLLHDSSIPGVVSVQKSELSEAEVISVLKEQEIW